MKHAYHQGQKQGVGDKLLAAGCGKRLERRRCHQRDNCYWTGGQLPAGAKEAANHRGKECGVEAVVGWEAGQLSIRHRLGNEDQRNRQTRDEIGAEHCQVVLLEPTQKWEDALWNRYPSYSLFSGLSGKVSKPPLGM